jgi:hypothetical protein
MAIQDEGVPQSYINFLENLAKLSSNYKSFSNFFKETDGEYTSSAKFTVVSIKAGLDGLQSFKLREFEGAAQLSLELGAIEASEDTCRLFLVENICPQTVSLFGERFNIDPQFFADHFNTESWYRIGEDSQLPALPSSQKSQEFITLRFIETQTILKALADQENDIAIIPEDAVSFILPDQTTARVGRKAGRLTPRPRAGQSFHPLLLARQAITVWFQKHGSRGQAWIGQSGNFSTET